MPGLPDLNTPRLKLRQWRADHVDALHALWIDAGGRRYLWDDEIISRERAAEVVEEALELIEAREIGMWSVYLGAEPEIIGFCGLREMHDREGFELLYAIMQDYWGRGLVVEASRAVLRDAFDRCGFESVTALADPPNLASFRVMEKLGMQFESEGISDGLPARFYRIDAAQFAPTL